MKRTAPCAAIALAFAIASSSVLADSIIVSWNCTLKEGKKPADVQAVNSKWLKYLHENVSDKISSAIGIPVVGDLSTFLFADTYPDLETWAKAQTAMHSDTGDDFDAMFDELADCKGNRLWRFQPTP